MQPGPTTGGCPELGLRSGERVSPLLVPSGTDGVWFGPRFFHPSIRRSFPGRPVCFRVRLGGRDLPFIWGAVHWEQQLLPHRSMQHSGLAALPAAGAPGLRIRRGYCDYRCADGAGARRGADQRHAGAHGRWLRPLPWARWWGWPSARCVRTVGGGSGWSEFFWTMSCPASGPFWPA